VLINGATHTTREETRLAIRLGNSHAAFKVGCGQDSKDAACANDE
jgi:hypothetical protein